MTNCGYTPFRNDLQHELITLYKLGRISGDDVGGIFALIHDEALHNRRDEKELNKLLKNPVAVDLYNRIRETSIAERRRIEAEMEKGV